MENSILRMENITKKFGEFTANQSISLELERGEVLTLLGENGAGKSTLMNVLCGLYHPTSGSIFVEGEAVEFNSPSDAVKMGIGMVHQHFMLVDDLTVFQNIIMGVSQDHSRLIHAKKLKTEIFQLSKRYGLDVELDRRISEISVGAQQRVEILKALWRGAKILILDEPTAVLTDEEAQGLFQIISRLTSEQKSVIFISHKLKEVMQVSDRIIVLRHGKAVESVNKKDADEQILANKMVGKQIHKQSYVKTGKTGDVIVSLKNVGYNKTSKHNGLHDITLDIHGGEILCIAGVDGNGQSELESIVSGLIKPDEGEICFLNKKVLQFDAKTFIGYGTSHVPADRNRMGLVGDMSIAENLMMKTHGELEFYKFKGWKLNRNKIKEHAEAMSEKYDIRCRTTEQKAQQLSGGNQQKIILARELEQNPKFLVAVHPTRGLDIGAATFVHNRLIEARDKGCAILMISTDLNEVLTVASRICVLFEGGIMGIYDGNQPPIEKISLAMAGKTKAG